MIRDAQISFVPHFELWVNFSGAGLQYGQQMAAVMFSIEGLDHVALTVRDLGKSAAWYRDTLGLERRHEQVWGDYPVFLCAGASGVALFSNPEAADGPDGAATTIMKHFAFRVTRSDFELARSVFQKRGVTFRFEDHGISHSLYIHDPDGYEVELTTYETGSS